MNSIPAPGLIFEEISEKELEPYIQGLKELESFGVRTTIFCPEDTPEVNVSEIALQGASVYRVNGLIDDCGKLVAQGKEKVGWFDTSTLERTVSDRRQEDDGA